MRAVAQTNDPVELHILSELAQLRSQNSRLKSYVEKSGLWAEMKEIAQWKPFDFFHYFCVSYQRKYRKEYHANGNTIHSYQRIEEFTRINNIDNASYKKFIDLAFSRHFTNNLIPNLGHIVNAMLYKKLMGGSVRDTKTQEWFDLDQEIGRQNEAFEKALQEEEEGSCGFLDKKLMEENEYIQRALRPYC
jgi:hypothetical protein